MNGAFDYIGFAPEAAPEYDYAEDGMSSIQKPSTPTENHSTANGSNTQDYLNSQKLIYSCYVSMETTEFTKTIELVNDLISKYDGFVESNYTSDRAYDWYYESYNKTHGTLESEMVIRIPTQHYEEFLSNVSGLGKVMSRNEDVQNITKNYSDTTTTITVLEKEEALLLNMMDECVSIADMMSVESRLSEVQRQLAIYRSSLNTMDVDIAFSTITLSIEEVVEYTYTPPAQLSFIERFVKACGDSFKSFVEFVQDLIIGVIFILPYITICILLVFIVKMCVKKRRVRKQKKVETQKKTVETVDEVTTNNDPNQTN